MSRGTINSMAMEIEGFEAAFQKAIANGWNPNQYRVFVDKDGFVLQHQACLMTGKLYWRTEHSSRDWDAIVAAANRRGVIVRREDVLEIKPRNR